MKKVIGAICVMLLAALQAQPATAIIGGSTDGTQHSWVAAIQSPDGQGLVFSGVAISTTEVLTVAHGAARIVQATGAFEARATFDPVADSSATWYTGTIHIDPAYNPNVPGVGDYAIVEFATPLPVDPATLPRLNELSTNTRLLTRTSLPLVSYGVAALVPGTPYPDPSTGGTRLIAQTAFMALKPQLLKVRMPDGDQACIGDSGGPVFLGESDRVIGITLGTLGGCISSGIVTQMRVDTREARAFIGHYVTLP